MDYNVLIKYMEQRYEEKIIDKKNINEPGPVITISRQTGCPAKRIADLLSKTINKRSNSAKWKCVSKEILTQSAVELELDPSKIQYIFEFETRGIWDEIFQSFSSKYYKSDRSIRSTIAEVIRTISEKGNVIIIGRGSVAIAHDIPKSLHINLVAPIEWRSELLFEKQAFNSIKEATEYVIETDNKREQFRNSFYGRNNDYTSFNVTFNCMTLSNEEIVSAIIKIMEIRKLILGGGER